METIALLALAFLISGGQLNEENVQYVTSNEEAVQELYNPSETRLSDIIHTDLAVRFDWENSTYTEQQKLQQNRISNRQTNWF